MQNEVLQQLESLEFVMVDLIKFSVLAHQVRSPCGVNLEIVPFRLALLL